MRISHIDSNGNMLAIGYEYLPERNIFAIFDDESAFVVGSDDTQENEKSFKIFNGNSCADTVVSFNRHNCTASYTPGETCR